MMPQMVAGQDAIAVGEQQIGGRRGRRPLVAAPGQAKPGVVVRRERERKVNPPGRGGNQPQGLVPRAVVGDDHLEPPGYALLNLERGEAAAQVLGPLIRGDDDRDVHAHPPSLDLHGLSTPGPPGIESKQDPVPRRGWAGKVGSAGNRQSRSAEPQAVPIAERGVARGDADQFAIAARDAIDLVAPQAREHEAAFGTAAQGRR